MATNFEKAAALYKVLDDGEGWEACAPYCTENASFECHSANSPIKDYQMMADYAAFMTLIVKGPVLTDIASPLMFSAYDESTNTACFAALFSGTHTNSPEGAPLPPPTNKSLSIHFSYFFTFNADGKVEKLIKHFNDQNLFQQLGWC
jgi:hypothetical protein